MHKDDDYRKQAADAQAMSDRSISVVEKEAWLRIAQGGTGSKAPTDGG